VAAWTNFARTGNPNGSGNSPWPQFSSQAGAKTILSENLPSSSLISDADFAAVTTARYGSAAGLLNWIQLMPLELKIKTDTAPELNQRRS